MQIGEFARICNTRISVLRHYDKAGILVPDYIDRFSGYRYYTADQIPVFQQIAALKKAGFSLAEIREILSNGRSSEEILQMFEKKKLDLQETLQNLEEALHKMNTLQETDIPQLYENTWLPFENDETIVGKWEIVGEYASKELFFTEYFADGKAAGGEIGFREIYFLPNGARYWCFGWTRGKLLIDSGDGSSVNEYTTEEVGGDRYMFVEWKSYQYRCEGKPTVLVLRQLDHCAYTADQIARRDDIDKPFEEDSRVLGRWVVHSYCVKKDDFLTNRAFRQLPGGQSLYFSEIELFEGGHCTSVYGDEVITGDERQVWTKGYVLRRWNQSACAYEIRSVNGKEYLIMEWKSGDYRWGGFETDYYVFERAS